MTALVRPARVLALTAMIGASTACSWLAGSSTPGTTTGEDAGDPAADAPKCRPEGAKATLGPHPWTVGMTTGAGWEVTEAKLQDVTDASHMPEYLHVAFKKDTTETMVEIAYSEDGPGDWTTDSYRLMPAPDHEPPQDLLKEVIATLRSWDAEHKADPFVRKREGVIDPFEGLPPCGPNGEPI